MGVMGNVEKSFYRKYLTELQTYCNIVCMTTYKWIAIDAEAHEKLNECKAIMRDRVGFNLSQGYVAKVAIDAQLTKLKRKIGGKNEPV